MKATYFFIFTILLAFKLEANHSEQYPKDAFLIQWSQMTPDSKFLSEHYDYWESYLPFDGLVIPINKEHLAGRYGDTRANSIAEENWPLSWTVFSDKLADINDYSHVIEDLNKPQFTKFKHNFIPLYLYFKHPGSFAYDWHDENQWQITLKNIKTLAQVAKDSNCKGIWFDTEQYASCCYWNYHGFKRRFRNKYLIDYTTCKKMMQKRGMEFIMAINSVFPNCELVLSFGTSMVYADALIKKRVHINNPINSKRFLLTSFIDGLLFFADDYTTITDGNEVSYYFHKAEEFKESKEIVKEITKLYSKRPEFYSKNLRVGFGIYPTHHEKTKRFSDKKLEEAVSNAIYFTDNYVWIWGEKELFWVKENEPLKIPNHPSIDFFSQTVNKRNALRKGDRPISQKYIEALKTGKRHGLVMRHFAKKKES